jgi:PilZ domain
MGSRTVRLRAKSTQTGDHSDRRPSARDQPVIAADLLTKSNIPTVFHMIDNRPLPERREFERVILPATAFALDEQGHDLGRVSDISGGGLLLDPGSPWARVALVKSQQFVVTIVEPASGNKTEMNVEVCYIHLHSIGLRFL